PGGAINIRTRRHRGGRSHQHIEASIGSFGTQGLRLDSFGEGVFWDHALVLNAQSSDNDFEYVNKNRAFNPADPNREDKEERNNAQSERASVLLRLGYRPSGRQRWEGSVSYFNQDQGLPALNNNAITRTQLSTDDLLTQLRWSAFATQPNGWDHRLRLFHRNLGEIYDDRASQIGLGSQHTKDSTTTTGAEWFASKPLGLHKLRSNLSWQQEQYQSNNLLSGNRSPESERQTLAAGLELDFTLLDGRMTLTPALRLLSFEDVVTGRNNYEEDYLTPQAGMRYVLGEHSTLKANVGRYVRIPSFFEQLGDRGFIKGNPSLTEETSDNVDIGLEWDWLHTNSAWLTRSRLSLTAFANRLEDAIVYVFNSQGIGQALNVGEAEITGAEISAEFSLRTATRIKLDFTGQDTENLSQVRAHHGKQLPGRYSEALNLNIEQWLSSNTRLFYRYHAERGIFYDQANLLEAKDRDEHDIGVAINWQSWDLSLEARNLKDENFESFNRYPEPGRSFWASLGYTFR
ncbi:MAG: TonB-dependent receptor plug domain-containing protein, partial [Nevskiales bacterium]